MAANAHVLARIKLDVNMIYLFENGSKILTK